MPRGSSRADAMERVVHDCRIFASPWPEVFGTDTESGRRYDRHWHTTFGVGLMERGAHRSMSGRGLVDAHVGQLITTNPGEVHDGWSLGASTRRWRMVYLDAAVLSTMVDCTPAVDVRLTRPVIDDEALISEVRLLLWHLERWSSSSQPLADRALACEEALVRACGRLLHHHSTAMPMVEVEADVARIRDRLADHLVSIPSLTELSTMAGVSRYQLLRRFERAYGMTPFRWQRQVRVERARVLIARQSPLAQVAAECGFADQSHMTRAFTEHFGFTPGAWAATLGPPRVLS